jgi:G3E family GTPase
VLVLAGFLGSGKTTLLNHLLAHSMDVRIGVIVNDFGSVGVDAMLIGGHADGVISLGNGCLCCAVGERGVGPLLDQLAGRASSVDVIVIEASGIAEPGALVQLVLGWANPRLTFGGLVEVVDAAEYERSRDRHPELDRHLALADLVVLNKADRVTEAGLARVGELCRAANRRAPLVVATHGVLDPALLFDVRLVHGRQLMLGQYATESSADDHAHHLHSRYELINFRTDRPLDPRRFVEFLDRRQEGVYRIKGVAYFGVTGYRQRFVVHAVGRYLRFHRSPWPRDQRLATALELIGTGMDRAALLAALAETERAEPADQDSILAVLRYTF